MPGGMMKGPSSMSAPTHRPVRQVSRRRPPSIDYMTALEASGPREPGHMHYLLGAGAAAYAISVVTAADMAVVAPIQLTLLAFVAGMIGGWFIREAADRRFDREVVVKAWDAYHERRTREYAVARARRMA